MFNKSRLSRSDKLISRENPVKQRPGFLILKILVV
jgi:hypothetical protein